MLWSMLHLGLNRKKERKNMKKEEIIEGLKNKYKGFVIYNKDNKDILQYEDIIEEYEEFNEGETIEAFIEDFILGINSNCEMIEEKDVLYYEAFEEFKR